MAINRYQVREQAIPLRFQDAKMNPNAIVAVGAVSALERAAAPERPPPRPVLPDAALKAQAAKSEPAPAAPSEQAHAAAVEALNRQLAGNGQQLAFEFDRSIGRVVFKLIDTQTNEVLRTIPSKEMLAIAQALAADQHAGTLLTARA